jgi:hypothetical protein
MVKFTVESKGGTKNQLIVKTHDLIDYCLYYLYAVQEGSGLLSLLTHYGVLYTSV